MRDSDSKPLAFQLARASWIAPLLVILINVFLSNVSADGDEAVTQSVVFTLFATLLFFTGLCCGVVALFGIKAHGWRKILLPSVVGILISGAMLGVIASNVFAAKNRNDPQRQIETALSNIKADLPQMVNDTTQFLDVSLEEDTVVYVYDFPGVPAADIDASAFVREVERGLLENYCTELTDFWRNGFNLTVKYRSGDGQLIAEVPLYAGDCHDP